jgi:hypothetical protein
LLARFVEADDVVMLGDGTKSSNGLTGRREAASEERLC